MFLSVAHKNSNNSTRSRASTLSSMDIASSDDTMWDSDECNPSVSDLNRRLDDERSPSPELMYLSVEELPGPQANHIQFDAFEDAEEQPINFSDTPAQVAIKKEKFTEVHRAEGAELEQILNVRAAGQEAAAEGASLLAVSEQRLRYDVMLRSAQLAAQVGATLQPQNERPPTPVREALRHLNHLIHTKWVITQNPIDDWDFSNSDSSDWTSPPSSDLSKTWPTPPSTPDQGDDMHPPSAEVHGAHPSESGWKLNVPNTCDYHRFLIPDPSIKRKLIVAPYVKYTMERHRPYISATFGDGYPVHSRSLIATPMDYLCPPLTAEQMQVLNRDEPFADAVNKVIDDYFPLDLAAGVMQYRYYKETQYAIQKTTHHLQDKEMKYLEKATEVLSELENANVLGRLLAHLDVLAMELDANPSANIRFSNVVNGFEGRIPYSAVNPQLNPLHDVDSIRKAVETNESRNARRHTETTEMLIEFHKLTIRFNPV